MTNWKVRIVLVAVGVVVSAAEKPPENYQQAMKDLGSFAQGISKAVSAEDYDAVAKYSASAKEAFGIVEAYWSKNADPAAVKSAQDGVKAAADLGVTANLKSKEGAEYAAKGIMDLCMGCHTTHREKAADGTFQIK
jgi:cytochrome c556